MHRAMLLLALVAFAVVPTVSGTGKAYFDTQPVPIHANKVLNCFVVGTRTHCA